MDTGKNWIEEFPCAVTVCDRDGTIIEMNQRSAATFAADGGLGLIGKNVLACHPEPSRSMLKGMLASGKANVYTIEKEGIRKLIYQSPWYAAGAYAGFVELSLPLPDHLPHKKRG